MSTRHLLNIGMGTVVLLLAASVSVFFMSLGDKGNDNVRIDLAISQQSLVQNLSHQVEALSNAGNMMKVNQARQELGATILHLDQNLTALVKGGTVTSADGSEIKVSRPSSSVVQDELKIASEIWMQTGLPLADLAAGEFSIFSSAGQEAAAGLHENGAELMDQFGKAADGIRTEAQTRYSKGQLARWFALGFTGLLLGLGLARFKTKNKPSIQAPSVAPSALNEKTPSAAAEEPAPFPEPSASQVWNSQPHQPFTSPVDFDNVNASVDQLSVDMNTIAGSTQKMQVAIDSVGHAMQGMLFSLNQMAQDTAEGYKIVRGANNAATYTHSTAGELAESAREMSRVVARVTQLAIKTKQVAGQIEAEAISTGSTGEAFTSVVAAEVKGLAQQTSQATAGIEVTVSDILGTARQYEEAIGQIIKNISAINKVSENLGELMLHPPAAGVAGTPLPSAAPIQLAPQPVPMAAAPEPAPAPTPAPTPAPAPAPAPVPAPVAEVEPAPEPEPEPEPIDDIDDTLGIIGEEPIGADPTAEEVADATSDAIEKAAADTEPSGSTGNVFMLGGPKKAKAPAKEEPKAEAPPAAEEKSNEGGKNIFMLNKPGKDPEVKKEPEPSAPEAIVEDPAPAEEKADENDSNIFILNKPKNSPAAEQPEPAPAEEAPVAETPAPEAAAEEEEEEEDSGSNIYNLKKPVKNEAAAPQKPAAKKEPVTVPADDGDEKKGDGGGNIFMLNKPK